MLLLNVAIIESTANQVPEVLRETPENLLDSYQTNLLFKRLEVLPLQ